NVLAAGGGAMSVTRDQVPGKHGRSPRVRRVLFFLLLLIVMDDAVDLLNAGAFVWAGDEYAVQGRRLPTHHTRLVIDDVRDPDRRTTISRQTDPADTVGRRPDPILSQTNPPRARSHIVSPADETSATLPQ